MSLRNFLCNLTWFCQNKYFNKMIRRRRRIRSEAQMKLLSSNNVPDTKNEIRLFVCVRNESLRLPYFLKYYFDLGVDRMLFVDNGSTDGTLDLLLNGNQSQIHVFQTEENYRQHVNWIDLLLHKYGKGNWCLVVDVDEIFIYPYCEFVSLRRLCAFLAQEKCDALHCFLLDMYSNKPIFQTIYRKGENPLSVASHFDSDTHIPFIPRFWNCKNAPKYLFCGGMRKRVFGLDTVTLSKFPLLKFNPEMYLHSGTHGVDGAAISNIQGALLHFKYFDDFISQSNVESARKQYWNDAFQYKMYREKILKNPGLILYCDKSKKLLKNQQLLDFKIMLSSEKFDAFIKSCQ